MVLAQFDTNLKGDLTETSVRRAGRRLAPDRAAMAKSVINDTIYKPYV